MNSGDGGRRYPALVLLGSASLLVLAVFAYLISARAVERLVHRGNDAAALITATLVEREFEHWIATLTSHAAFPALAAGVAAGDVEEVRRGLAIFVEAHPRLDRAFVTDTGGLLWVDFPVARESLGRRFDDRDWYRGVSAGEGAYVSEVYRRNAEPQIQVVAVAVPVRSGAGGASGAVSGFLVAQVRLDGLTDLLRRVDVGEEGLVLLRDHTGALAAHPSLDLQRRSYREYAAVLPAAAAGLSRGRYADPLTGQTVLASTHRAGVGGHDWTVISQQPVEAAFAPIRGLAIRLGAAGILLAVLMGLLLRGLVRENARRREAETELRSVNEELERRVVERTAALREREDELLQAQKMEAVGQLAGGVAHDFNNLLTVILGSTDFILSALPEDSPERQEVEAVRQAAERAAELTRQLLAFSRRQVMQPRILDVNESVSRMRGIFERVLGEDIELVWRLRPELHPVKFDPGQIEQVIMNLAVNARDAMPRGGTLTIETANVMLDEAYVERHPEARVGPHVVMAVSDTGTGMDAATRQRIFEPFYTTKELGRGTGLGLSAVYGIVRQGGGHLRVFSEDGRGTTFKVYLPRTDEVAEEPSPEAAPASSSARSRG